MTEGKVNYLLLLEYDLCLSIAIILSQIQTLQNVLLKRLPILGLATLSLHSKLSQVRSGSPVYSLTILCSTHASRGRSTADGFVHDARRSLSPLFSSRECEAARWCIRSRYCAQYSPQFKGHQLVGSYMTLDIPARASCAFLFAAASREENPRC